MATLNITPHNRNCADCGHTILGGVERAARKAGAPGRWVCVLCWQRAEYALERPLAPTWSGVNVAAESARHVAAAYREDGREPPAACAEAIRRADLVGLLVARWRELRALAEAFRDADEIAAALVGVWGLELPPPSVDLDDLYKALVVASALRKNS